MTSRSSLQTPSRLCLRWGILGTGRIASIFAEGLTHSQYGKLVAVGSRSEKSAQSFVKKFRASTSSKAKIRTHGTYKALLADKDVDAVYVATPHPWHAEWTLRAAEAGKHILCEKPLGLNHAEAMVMVQSARENHVLLAEAFMYRFHPQTQKIVDLIQEGVIGEVRMITASFGFSSGFDAKSRLWSNAYGGGGIMDVGCYPISFARRIAGAASGKLFLDPVSVQGVGRLHPVTGVDEYASALLEFKNGVIAQAVTSITFGLENTATIYGTKGRIFVPFPWQPSLDGKPSIIQLTVNGKPSRKIRVKASPLYSIEADVFAEAVRSGAKEVVQMSTDDTLGNLSALDQWRKAIGLVYDAEKVENFKRPISRRPLRSGYLPKRSAKSRILIPRAVIPGIDKEASRLVMGCDNQLTFPHGAAMWDDFFERNGNLFDTAYVYGNGVPESLFGHWMKNRKVREDVVLIVKGAHTPNCHPEALTKQLEISLDRLQTDYADIYLMHRDNLDIPVDEFVDVLNRHRDAGRMRIFGGSNWSIERIDAANRYAKKHGLTGFTAVSNQFSLARMVDPVWAGCISASDPQSKKWLASKNITLFAWSSQARGFFTERAGRDKRSDAELVRCWYAEDNFKRRDRAIELAKQKGVSPIAIAGSYVLSQPFLTFPLIGPRAISETASSLHCLEVPLSPEELAWLNLESDTRDKK